jgi:hypothetical protein
VDLKWHICSGGGKTAKGGCSLGLVDEDDEEFVLEIRLWEPLVIFTPPVDFPPANGAAKAKPAHLVLRGRKILWILDVVRCVPVAVEDGEGMVTTCINGRRSN